MDISRDLKKLWNMKVMVLPVLTGTVLKGLEKSLGKLEISWRIQTIRTLAWLELLEESWWIKETYCHLDFREKLPVKIVVKTSKE